MGTVSVSEGGEPSSETFRKEEAGPPEGSCLLLPLSVLWGLSERALLQQPEIKIALLYLNLKISA